MGYENSGPLSCPSMSTSLRTSLVGISAVTVILIFAPLASNSSLPYTNTGHGSNTNAELCSSAYKVMIYSSMSVCVAKLIEFSLEVLLFHKAAHTAIGWSTRWGLLSSLLVHNFVNAVVVLPPPGRLDVYWAMLAFRDYFCILFIVVFLAENCASVWTTQYGTAFVLLAAVSNVTRQYSQYTYTFTNSLGIVAALTGGLIALSSAVLLVKCYNTIILRSSVVSNMTLVLNSILVGGCIGGSLESLDLESTAGIKTYQGQQVSSQTTLHVTIYGAFIHTCVTLIIIFFNAALSWNEDEVQRRTLSTKRTFVRYVSHEIRTPLNIVSMGLQLLSTGLASPGGPDLSVLGDIVGDMQKSSREAVKILDQLLMYEKIDGNLFILNSTNVSVLAFLARNVRSFEVQAAAERKELKMAVDDPRLERVLESLVEEGLSTCSPFMLVDDFRLSQVLRNFVSNGLKFSPAGSKIVARCSFFARSHLGDEFSKSPCHVSKATHVRFSVTDQGVGIDAETVKKIGREGYQFQPDKLQSNNGSGLGLFISQGIVSKHNGLFGVTSPGLNKGTTAFFEVALAPQEQEDDKFDNNPSHYQHVIETRAPPDIDDDDKQQFQPLNTTPPEVKLRKRSSKISPGSFECDPVQRRSSFERIASIMPGVMASNHSSSVAPEAESKEAAALHYQPHQPSQPLPVRDNNQADGSGLPLLRILLVDDSGMNRKFCAHYIRKELAELGTSCIVTEAENGVSGVAAMLSSPQPDLVLLDNHMPQRCGPDAARMALNAGFSGQIVGLTGSVLQMEIEDFKAAGVAVVLEKPLDSERLRALLLGTISALGR